MFKVFVSKLIWGSTNFFEFFSSVFAFKTVDAQMLFWSIFFFKCTKKKLITVKNGQNSFFFCVFKNTDQKDIGAYIVLKAESKQKPEENIFWGVFLLKPKMCFFGGPK